MLRKIRFVMVQPKPRAGSARRLDNVPRTFPEDRRKFILPSHDSSNMPASCKGEVLMTGAWSASRGRGLRWIAKVHRKGGSSRQVVLLDRAIPPQSAAMWKDPCLWPDDPNSLFGAAF